MKTFKSVNYELVIHNFDYSISIHLLMERTLETRIIKHSSIEINRNNLAFIVWVTLTNRTKNRNKNKEQIKTMVGQP